MSSQRCFPILSVQMTVTHQMQRPRPGYVRQLLATYSPDVLAWFVFMATASAWLPAYNGNIDNSDRWRLTGVYLVIAVIAEIAVRVRVRTRRDAVLASLPLLRFSLCRLLQGSSSA